MVDLNLAYEWCTHNKCEITMEPVEELWGDLIFTCLDPFEYELQIHQQIKKSMQKANLTKAYQSAWVGKEDKHLDEKNTLVTKM